MQGISSLNRPAIQCGTSTPVRQISLDTAPEPPVKHSMRSVESAPKVNKNLKSQKNFIGASKQRAAMFSDAAKIGEGYGYCEINLNVGCPRSQGQLIVCAEWGLISLPYQVTEEADALGIPLVGWLEIA